MRISQKKKDEIDEQIGYYRQAAYEDNPNKYKHVGNSMVRGDEYKDKTSITPREKRTKKESPSWLDNPNFIPGILLVSFGSLAVGGLIIGAGYLFGILP